MVTSVLSPEVFARALTLRRRILPTLVFPSLAVVFLSLALTAGFVATLLVSIYGYFGFLAFLHIRREKAFLDAQMACRSAVTRIASDIRAGKEVDDALHSAFTYLAAVTDFPLEKVIIAARVHYGIAASLMRLPPPLAASGYRLAAIWRLKDNGIALATLLSTLDRELAALEALESTGKAETAGARATAALLTALPLLGIGFGFVLDANPVEILLHTSEGILCAFVAAALHVTGWWWSHKVVSLWRVSL